MKPLVMAALTALTLSAPALAQRTDHVSALGSEWTYLRYETGAAITTMLTGQPSLHEGQPSVVLTLMTRDGRSLGEGDRADAALVAAALCAPGGYQFNRASRGAWIANGGLSFYGDCTRW